ncbi:hypothetical protein ACFHWD_03700 [Clostridium sp. MT-14]|uniref:hypothetical protein n=1 Tax=Clostridium sp. MT-14 TaxID=3348360 RepID=UPI0035F35937
MIDENYNNDLENYLNNIVGKKLFKDDKKELIDKINLRDNRNRQQKSISLINTYLKENKFTYIIDTGRETKKKLDNGDKNPRYRKTYWKVGEIKYNKE